MGDNTAAADDDELINNIANNLTLVNTGKSIAIFVSLQNIVNVMIKPFARFCKEKLISEPDHLDGIYKTKKM